MQTNRASKTAFRAAISRTAHQLLDFPVVFEDTIALRVLGPSSIALMRAGGRRVRVSVGTQTARFLRGA